MAEGPATLPLDKRAITSAVLVGVTLIDKLSCHLLGDLRFGTGVVVVDRERGGWRKYARLDCPNQDHGDRSSGSVAAVRLPGRRRPADRLFDRSVSGNIAPILKTWFGELGGALSGMMQAMYVLHSIAE